jgi:hypothetical protein
MARASCSHAGGPSLDEEDDPRAAASDSIRDMSAIVNFLDSASPLSAMIFSSTKKRPVQVDVARNGMQKSECRKLDKNLHSGGRGKRTEIRHVWVHSIECICLLKKSLVRLQRGG